MSPDDIELVTGTWRHAVADREALVGAIAERLAGAEGFRTERAEWIVRAVSSLSPVLARPTAFAPVAIDLISLRYPVTSDELAVERDALLGAVAARCAPLGDDARRAWGLAIDLFGEIVCSMGLDPFATFAVTTPEGR